MLTEQELTLPKKLYSLSVSLERISQSYLVYITKLLHQFGISPECLNEAMIPFKISSLAYFKGLIKHIKQDDVYFNLHITFVLTKPNRKDYYDNILFFKSYYAYSNEDRFLFESYYDKFDSKQTILALQNNVNTDINKQKLSEDILFIFKPDNPNNNIPMSFDILLNEFEEINLFFKDFLRHYRKFATNKVISKFNSMTVLLSPSTYTKKLIQCKNSIKSSCITILYSLNPYSCIESIHQVYQSSFQGYGSMIYSSVYQPFESLSVHIKDKGIGISANLSFSSSGIKDYIIDYISNEINKLKRQYGNLAASLCINKSNLFITLRSQVVNINKNWLNVFVNQLNDNFLYVRAKGIIDNLYIKWLQSNKIEEEQYRNSHNANNLTSNWSIQKNSFDLLSISLKVSNHLSSDTLVFEKEDEYELESMNHSQNNHNNNLMIYNYKTENTNETEEGKCCKMMSTLNLSKELSPKINSSKANLNIVEYIDDKMLSNSFNQSLQSNYSINNNETQSISCYSIDFTSLYKNKYEKENPFFKKLKKKKKKKGAKNLRFPLKEIH